MWWNDKHKRPPPHTCTHTHAQQHAITTLFHRGSRCFPDTMGEKKHKKEKRDKKEKRSQKDRGRSGKKRSRKHSKKDKKKHRSQSKHRRRHAEASLSDVTSSSSSDEATSQHSGSPPRASKRRRQAEPIGTPPDFEVRHVSPSWSPFPHLFASSACTVVL